MEITGMSIKDLEVQFISKKENNYETEMCYFKIVDYQLKKKLNLFENYQKL